MSISLMCAASAPKYWAAMAAVLHAPARQRIGVLALAAAAAALLAGCGTPAVVTPPPTPLPGFTRDIRAAHNAVQQTEQQAQGDASIGATPP